jgi:hypothetical protein
VAGHARSQRQGELDRVSQTLTGRVRELAERYATPLPELTADLSMLALESMSTSRRWAREFASIRTGPFGTLLKAAEYSGRDGVPLISVGEIGLGAFRISEETPLVPEVVVRRLPQYVLRAGDVVFGRKGAVERSALVGPDQEGWFLGSDGMSVRPGPGCHAPYLAFQFQSPQVQQWLLQNATGTTMASLNQEVLGRVAIPIAPLREQVAIAAALSDVDGLIGALDRLIAKKRELKQAAMQQLLTGQTRLPGFSSEWEDTTLGKIGECVIGLTYAPENVVEHGLLVLRSSNVQNNLSSSNAATRPDCSGRG